MFETSLCKKKLTKNALNLSCDNSDAESILMYFLHETGARKCLFKISRCFEYTIKNYRNDPLEDKENKCDSLGKLFEKRCPR